MVLQPSSSRAHRKRGDPVFFPGFPPSRCSARMTIIYVLKETMKKNSKILITGSTGMIGSSLVRLLKKQDFTNLLTPTHEQLELCDQKKVSDYFKRNKPEYVFHLAAVVGGIHANNERPGDFIIQNTVMQNNVISAAYEYGAKKLLFPGSACTYPKMAKQPIAESEFLNGQIEPTNIAYAAAKINGIVLCQSYKKQFGFNTVVPMPTNTYGVGDNFDPKQSHVIPSLMKRFHEARKKKLKSVEIWGTGKPLREFLFVDDLADALVFLIKNHNSAEIINVGTMKEITIAKLATEIAKVVGYKGKILFDKTKPDGAPRKCLNSKKLLDMGWKPSITLQNGLKRMYKHHFEGKK